CGTSGRRHRWRVSRCSSGCVCSCSMGRDQRPISIFNSDSGPAMRGAPAHCPGRSLGSVIPRLLVAACLLDVAFRFVSIEPFTFRAWETLRRYHPSGVSFEPNRRYSNERSYGDLTAIGNLPALRQYRAEVFTTDTLGFRNAVHVLETPVDAILVGD